MVQAEERGGKTVLLIAWLAPALSEIVEMTRPPILCTFPDASAAGLPAQVRIIDPEAEVTPNGQFKIAMHLGAAALTGRVLPDDRSEARDVVMRARGKGDAVYLIALRDDGVALLRYRAADGAEAIEAEGACTGFERHLARWLAS